MEHEAIVHTVAMLAAALVGLILGNVLDVGLSDLSINLALAFMLYFVFVCIDGKALRDAFRDVNFTGTSVLINFLWTPFFAFGLGYLFFSGDADIRIGLLLALAAPCTDWYLVFTAAAKGDVTVSSAILPLNMVLQIVLTPVYLLLFFNSDISIGSLDPVILSLASILAPLVVAMAVRYLAGRSQTFGCLKNASIDNASLGQIVFLCLAVFIMFYCCSGDITDNWETLVTCIVPFLIFFIVNSCLSLAVAKRIGWNYDRSSSLLFTTLARNSPLILAMMSPIFQDDSLVLAVLVVCPLIELPFLSVMSFLRARLRTEN